MAEGEKESEASKCSREVLEVLNRYPNLRAVMFVIENAPSTKNTLAVYDTWATNLNKRVDLYAKAIEAISRNMQTEVNKPRATVPPPPEKM